MRVIRLLPALACTFSAFFVVLACDETMQGPVVDIVAQGTAFTPASTTVTATDTLVLWGFADGPHDLVFEDGAPNPGPRSSGTFTRNYAAVAAGTHRFRCTVHSTSFTAGMVGTVVK